MKISVSVPDELWRKAEVTFQTTSPSVIVQSALSVAIAKVVEDQAAALKPFAEACDG